LDLRALLAHEGLFIFDILRESNKSWNLWYLWKRNAWFPNRSLCRATSRLRW
jgi:hypothetical protein